MKDDGNFLKKAGALMGLVGRFGGYTQEINELAREAGMTPVAAASAKKVYDSFFKRYERPDYGLEAGVYCMARTNAERKELEIMRGGVKLKGYFYPAKRSRGTVVLAHGIHAGADDLLPLALKFVRNGYDVLSYDGTGTYDSEGEGTVGLCQALVDLNGVLNYVKESGSFRKPLFLTGHSCGGYAVTSVLALHGGISACAAIAPPNNCFTLILEKGRQYAGGLAANELSREFLNAYQKRLFGDFSGCSGVKGINSVDIPVLVAHGLNDKVITLGKQSIIARKHEITNRNVSYYLGTGLADGHDSVWHSFRAEEYRREVDEKAKEMDDEAQRREFFATVDHERYSEVNDALFEGIITAFERA